MLQHTFRGSTLKTWLRLEDEREAFRRYRAIRQLEREYISGGTSTTGATGTTGALSPETTTTAP